MADKRVTIPSWVFDAAREETPPLVYNTTPPKAEPIDPFRAADFLDEIVEVCNRHGLWIIGDHADLIVTREKLDAEIREAIIDV